MKLSNSISPHADHLLSSVLIRHALQLWYMTCQPRVVLQVNLVAFAAVTDNWSCHHYHRHQGNSSHFMKGTRNDFKDSVEWIANITHP